MSLKQILKLWPLFPDIAHNIQCLPLKTYLKLPALHMTKGIFGCQQKISKRPILIFDKAWGQQNFMSIHWVLF